MFFKFLRDKVPKRHETTLLGMLLILILAFALLFSQAFEYDGGIDRFDAKATADVFVGTIDVAATTIFESEEFAADDITRAISGAQAIDTVATIPADVPAAFTGVDFRTLHPPDVTIEGITVRIRSPDEFSQAKAGMAITTTQDDDAYFVTGAIDGGLAAI
jgi:hypothetical protein